MDNNLLQFPGRKPRNITFKPKHVVSQQMMRALDEVSKAKPQSANVNKNGDLVNLSEMLTIHKSAQEFVASWHGWILSRHQNDRYATQSNLEFLHLAEALVNELRCLAVLKIFETKDLTKACQALDNAADVLAETIHKINLTLNPEPPEAA